MTHQTICLPGPVQCKILVKPSLYEVCLATARLSSPETLTKITWVNNSGSGCNEIQRKQPTNNIELLLNFIIDANDLNEMY